MYFPSSQVQSWRKGILIDWLRRIQMSRPTLWRGQGLNVATWKNKFHLPLVPFGFRSQLLIKLCFFANKNKMVELLSYDPETASSRVLKFHRILREVLSTSIFNRVPFSFHLLPRNLLAVRFASQRKANDNSSLACYSSVKGGVHHSRINMEGLMAKIGKASLVGQSW